MPRLLGVAAVALALTVVAPPQAALADDPTPTPPASPVPTGSPDASPTPSAAPSATASPSATPTASPSADPSDPLVAEELERAAGARAELMRNVIAATSLLERILAQQRLALAERDFLEGRTRHLRDEMETTVLRAAHTRAKADERRIVLERLLEQTYRVSRTSALEVLLRRGSVVDVVVHMDGLAALSEQEHEVVRELRSLEADLERERGAMAEQEAELVALSEAVAAKEEALEDLAARAEALAAAATAGERAVGEAEIALLRDMAEANARESQATDELIAEIARRSGVELPTADRWTWPLEGRVTQEFGPSGLVLEPPRTYRGLRYPHFHDGLDIAAPLGSPVRAAARGRVAFVGHIAGGAMVVVIAHEEGHVTLYGHLDDTSAPPPVRAGDVVEAGERIGAVGLTGVTTGPHLHFVVSQGEEPIDPRVVLPTEP
ncbi:MAG: peptidoglycan DD-metalloendopeptidase family protein [Candidatus Limnocylindria bacterium]